MKIISLEEIENYQIITGINNASVDPEETDKLVDVIIEKNPDILLSKTREELLTENTVFSRISREEKIVDDTEGDKLKCVFDNLGENEKLLFSGEVIPDLRNTEYWIKKDGVWKKEIIEHLGVSMPVNAVLPDKLSQTQQQEIAEQTEIKRVANLTPEQKMEEKEYALNAAKREVRYLKDEADIADDPSTLKQNIKNGKQKFNISMCNNRINGK